MGMLSMESGMERQPDPAARRAGLLLILTAAATIVAVLGRVGAAADHSTLAESLVAISASKGLYGIGGAARFISGVTLIAGAWFLLRTWIIASGWARRWCRSSSLSRDSLRPYPVRARLS